MPVSHKIRSFILTMGMASILVTTAAFVLGLFDSEHGPHAWEDTTLRCSFFSPYEA